MNVNHFYIFFPLIFNFIFFIFQIKNFFYFFSFWSTGRIASSSFSTKISGILLRSDQSVLKGLYELLFIPSIFTSFRYPLLLLNWSINCSPQKLYINCFIPLCSYYLVSREHILFLTYLWAPTNPARLSSIFLEVFYHPTNQNQLFRPLCSSLWTCCVYYYYLHRPLSFLLVLNQFIHSSIHPFIQKLCLKCLVALCKEMGM